MTSNEILKADMLDILFDNRNKQYGAYALRKHYSQRLSLSIGISLSMVLLFFLLMPKERSSETPDRKDQGGLIVETIDIPPIKTILPPPVPIKPPVQRFKQLQFTTTVIEKDKNVKVDPPDLSQLLTSVISNKTVIGDPVSSDVPVFNEPVPDNPAKEEPNTTTKPLQKEPEFPGGQEAWLNFLRRNLVVPGELEPGEKKTVSIRFYVSDNGIVTDFQVLQSAGKAYDNEVIRVLKRMPKWKPAIQNGVPVARAFTQPVTFMGAEE
jgi:protein TonB